MTFQDNLVRNVDRKLFDFDLVKRLNLTRTEINGKRHYNVDHPDGSANLIAYPSVTTVIGEKSDKNWIKEWEELVGKDRAAAILESAKHRGTAIHSMAESYLYGGEYWKGNGTLNVITFNKFVPIINEHVSHIYGIELPLFSHKLKAAGTADLVCWWDRQPAVVDFKTARNVKSRTEIEGYFIQAATYAKMFNELYHIHMDKIVIILLADHEDSPVIFDDYVFPDWNKKVLEYFT